MGYETETTIYSFEGRTDAQVKKECIKRNLSKVPLEGQDKGLKYFTKI